MSALSIAEVLEKADLWPVYEFRPIEEHSRGTVLRYAGGDWVADDGQFDVAFISTGFGAPYALYVDLPYQRNIVWSGLTGSWAGTDHDHPRGGNPWHYMLRDGEQSWGGDWGRARHTNSRAGDAAMSKCASINGCASGRGPSFKHGDPYFERGLVRRADTHEIVDPPRKLTCMYCGDKWEEKILLREAAALARREGR